MADLPTIRTAIALRAEAVDGIRGYPEMPDSPVVPCAIISPAPGVFLDDVSLDGAEDLNLIALVLVAKVAPDTTQDNLDAYASEGASDIRAAIDSGATADWDFVVTEGARGYGNYTFGTGDGAQVFLGFEVPIAVGVS